MHTITDESLLKMRELLIAGHVGVVIQLIDSALLASLPVRKESNNG